MISDGTREKGQQQMNCYQKLELLNEKLKELARIMTDMKEGMKQARAASE